jgi:hypothetical protein
MQLSLEELLPATATRQQLTNIAMGTHAAAAAHLRRVVRGEASTMARR